MIKTKWLLVTLLTGGVGAIGPAAAGPDVQPMVVAVGGALQIDQELPGTCDNVHQSANVRRGRFVISPAGGIDAPGGKYFELTQGNVSFEPFTIERHCMLQDEVRTYSALGVQIARGVSFVASPSGAFTIPKEAFLLYEAASVIHNGHPLDETGYMQPARDVTGTIDLTSGTLQIQMAIATTVGTPLGDYHGTITANLSGVISFPDADADGIPDRRDNCRLVRNPDQTPIATPTITAPFDLTVASCVDHRLGSPIAIDVCDGGPVTVTSNAPAQFALGDNVVTWTGQDAQMRIATTTQRVTVVDTTRPTFTFVPPDISLNDCKAADLGVPTAVDDCAGTPALSNDALAKYLVGTTTVTWTATDVSGNRQTATQMVTVHDTVAPAITCAATTPGNGPADRTTGDPLFRVSATDACTASPAIRLGSYDLAVGEIVRIKQSRTPGVRLIPDDDHSPKRIRHFEVGPAQNVIIATDGSGNSATATCVAPGGN